MKLTSQMLSQRRGRECQPRSRTPMACIRTPSKSNCPSWTSEASRNHSDPKTNSKKKTLSSLTTKALTLGLPLACSTKSPKKARRRALAWDSTSRMCMIGRWATSKRTYRVLKSRSMKSQSLMWCASLEISSCMVSKIVKVKRRMITNTTLTLGIWWCLPWLLLCINLWLLPTTSQLLHWWAMGISTLYKCRGAHFLPRSASFSSKNNDIYVNRKRLRSIHGVLGAGFQWV